VAPRHLALTRGAPTARRLRGLGCRAFRCVATPAEGSAHDMIRAGRAMNRHVGTILVTVAAAVLSGTVFVVALFHQFALVEVAASLLTTLQVFFLSSAIGDKLEDKQQTNKVRNGAVVSLTVLLAVFYAVTAYLH
jgi:hypothetical protein